MVLYNYQMTLTERSKQMSETSTIIALLLCAAVGYMMRFLQEIH